MVSGCLTKRTMAYFDCFETFQLPTFFLKNLPIHGLICLTLSTWKLSPRKVVNRLWSSPQPSRNKFFMIQVIFTTNDICLHQIVQDFVVFQKSLESFHSSLICLEISTLGAYQYMNVGFVHGHKQRDSIISSSTSHKSCFIAMTRTNKHLQCSLNDFVVSHILLEFFHS